MPIQVDFSLREINNVSKFKNLIFVSLSASLKKIKIEKSNFINIIRTLSFFHKSDGKCYFLIFFSRYQNCIQKKFLIIVAYRV